MAEYFKRQPGDISPKVTWATISGFLAAWLATTAVEYVPTLGEIFPNETVEGIFIAVLAALGAWVGGYMKKDRVP